MITSLQDSKLDKFNISETPVIEFRAEHFKDNFIEIPFPRKLMFQMIKYRLENGYNNPPDIKVKSPTGNIKVFIRPTSFGSGVQYICDGLILRLINEKK